MCIQKDINSKLLFFRQTLIYIFEEIVDNLITSARMCYFFFSRLHGVP